MTSRPSSTVSIAFEMLLDAIDKEIRAVTERGMRAFETRDFQLAADLSQRASQLTQFRGRVEAISHEWASISCGTQQRSSVNQTPPARTKESRRLPKGVRTPEDTFFLPILRVLDEMGGRGSATSVLDRIYELMGSRLTAVDLEPLPSNPREIRWRNTAMWARKKLVQKGLLSPHSPTGIWEITEAGRAYLRQHGSDQSAGES